MILMLYLVTRQPIVRDVLVSKCDELAEMELLIGRWMPSLKLGICTCHAKFSVCHIVRSASRVGCDLSLHFFTATGSLFGQRRI